MQLHAASKKSYEFSKNSQQSAWNAYQLALAKWTNRVSMARSASDLDEQNVSTLLVSLAQAEAFLKNAETEATSAVSDAAHAAWHAKLDDRHKKTVTRAISQE